MKYRVLKVISTTLFVLPMAVSAFSVTEEEDLIRAYGDEDFISIATGSRQLISQAPAVASVITAEDIRAMGATDLDEILETVPGLHVSRSPRAYSPLYTMRGIYSENNPQVLVLINDIPITNVYVGDRSQVWAGMPINNISRIEVIRGPGSAIYGADAFAGTINIITKSHEDIRGTEAGVRTGSFNSHEGWILHGSSWNNFDISLSVEIQKTDGHDRVIEADAQTLFDNNLPFPAASIAPDSVNLDRKLIETRADIRRGDWRFRLGYQGRKDVGTGAGVAYALDPTGSGDSDRFNADLTYSTLLSQNWDFTGQLSYLDTSAETNLVLYPPGAIFGGPFPEGVIGSPHVYERHTRLGLSSFYHGFDKHRLRIGIGAIHNDMYKIREFKNFEGPFIPLPEVQDVSNNPAEVFIDPNDRKVFYAFIQDEWDIAYNWRLTSGLRYDNYSDFGDTLNPRLALVWQTTPDLTTKVLYGRAFRAPAFNELYNNPNNPVARGNPDLKPETIDTYELAFNYQATPDLNTSLNLFHYRMSDIIRFSPDTGEAENFGKIEGHGLELEARYDVTPRFRVIGNYAIQESTDQDDAMTANAPQHMVYMRANWAFIDNWSLNTQLNWISDRKRSPEDSRVAIDDYLVTDLTLRYRAFTSPWEFALSGRNIFDEDAREPSPRLSPPAGPVPPGEALIPNDLPLAGRHFFVEARYHFD